MQSRAAGWSSLHDRADAPPPFTWNGKTVVPIEFSDVNLAITIDVGQRRATGRAEINFSAGQRGCPLLDMVPSPLTIAIDGEPLPVSAFPEVAPPDQQAKVRVLDKVLDPAGSHRLTVEHSFGDATVSFGDGGVRFAFFMTDLEERGYLEQHAPANLEFNQFPLTAEIRLLGATSEHHLFANGRSSKNGDTWRVSFPSYFSSSSFFLHLTNRELHIERDHFTGAEGNIPVVAYGEREQAVKDAVANARTVFAELEQAYGPFAHDTLTVYVTDDPGGGGMEYCGATMTSLRALEHEIFHSWFARGVMPANGNAGWIDEGMARWRDHGYPNRRPDPNREPVNLAGFSPYRRHTPGTAYAMGSLLLSELEYMLRQEGSAMRPLLSKLYRQKRRQQITTEYLKAFLEQETGKDLGRMFDRFVYGKQPDQFFTFEEMASRRALTTEVVRELEAAAAAPPRRPFTRQELNALR